MANNFDFFVGEWRSTQRRLKEVLTGCEEWYEFPGTTRCWSVFDGAGNIDEVVFPTLGFSGVTVRLYDPETQLWSLYWARSGVGLGLPPVVGRFDDSGRGVFTDEEDYQGHHITCAYIWSDITSDSARWEQAFSVDGGMSWETNWVAEFSRTA